MALAAQINDNSQIPIHQVDLKEHLNIKDAVIALGNILISNIVLIAGFLAVLFLIFAGIKYITSAGNPERAKEARAGVINVVIGVIVIVATFYIVKFAISLGTTITNPF